MCSPNRKQVPTRRKWTARRSNLHVVYEDLASCKQKTHRTFLWVFFISVIVWSILELVVALQKAFIN